jgi:hypothetical protein
MGSKVHIHKNPYANMAPGPDKAYWQEKNPYGMTVSQMRHQFQNQLQEGRTLEDALGWSNSAFNTGVKANQPYQYLINDTGEDIPGLITYEALGMENRPLADQFGGSYDLEQIKGTLASLFPDNPLYAAVAAEAAEEETGTGTETGTETETPSYLTADDLTAWWEGIDKSEWSNQQPKGMDDFMKFMMFMSMMQPQQSGGGSQYGYGGLTPGGVVSQYNPMDNISQLVTAFGQLPGSSSLNVTGTGNSNQNQQTPSTVGPAAAATAAALAAT